MKPPLYVRPLTVEERRVLEQALRCADAFTLRRAQVLLASARGERPRRIADALGCAVQTVRNTLRAFHTEGLACLRQQSTRPKSSQPVLDPARCERLQHLLHQSPREFGSTRSTWTLDLAAEVCVAQGITAERVSDETIRRAMKRLGTRWKRAKHWITSPDPQYARKKSNAIA